MINMLKAWGNTFNCWCKNPRHPNSSNNPYTKTKKTKSNGSVPFVK